MSIVVHDNKLILYGGHNMQIVRDFFSLFCIDNNTTVTIVQEDQYTVKVDFQDLDYLLLFRMTYAM